MSHRRCGLLAWLCFSVAFGVTALVNDATAPPAVASTQTLGPTATPAPTDPDSSEPAQDTSASSTSDDVVLYSKEYFLTHFPWHSGGAWMFHRLFHECEKFNQSCSFQRAINSSRPLASFQVSSTVIDHMDWVEVQYDLGPGVMPEPKDFIAVYPVDEEDKEAFSSTPDHDFFDYSLLPTLDASEGKVAFGPLVNMRCAYQFRYIHYISPLRYEVLASSPHVEMAKGVTQPLQVHLALTGRTTEMRVMWTSGKVSEPQVLYGTDINNLTTQALADTDSYKASDLCSANATSKNASWYRHPGYLHDAVLTELHAGQTYFYKVGSSNGIWSDVFQFKMPPLGTRLPQDPKATDASKPQSFIVFGDLGPSILMEKDPDLPDDLRAQLAQVKNPQTFLKGVSHPTKSDTTMDLIEADILDGTFEYLALFHVGDLSYARGRTYQWDQFGAVIEPVASQIPYMVAVGNHEYDYLEGGSHDLSGAGTTNGWHPVGGNYRKDSNGECGVPTVKRFHMPDNGNKVFWYSVDVGIAHHVVISSEHNFTGGSPMYQWLEKDLTNVDRTKTPWVFLYLHRAMYCSQDFRPDWQVSEMIRRELEPLLQKHHVDAVFSGHYHSYERTCPVLQEQCRSEKVVLDGMEVVKALGPVHFMIGSAGAELDDTRFKANIPWSANAQLEYGYGRLHVFNASHAQFEFFRIRGREVNDSYWIVSDHTW